MNMCNYTKCIIITVIALLVITTAVSDAKHYSTANPNQHVVHKTVQHVHNDNAGGNPPPNLNPITDDERRGVGQHWIDDHPDDY